MTSTVYDFYNPLQTSVVREGTPGAGEVFLDLYRAPSSGPTSG